MYSQAVRRFSRSFEKLVKLLNQGKFITLKCVEFHTGNGAKCVIDELITASWGANKDLIRRRPINHTITSHKETKTLLKRKMHKDETPFRCTRATAHLSESSRNIHNLEPYHQKLKKRSRKIQRNRLAKIPISVENVRFSCSMILSCRGATYRYHISSTLADT